MFKKLILVAAFLFSFNTCHAGITNMSINQFINKFEPYFYQFCDAKVLKVEYFDYMSMEDVHTIIFSKGNFNVYICSEEGDIKQLLFISKDNDEEGLTYSLAALRASLLALGYDMNESGNIILGILKKRNTKYYVYNKAIDKKLLVAYDEECNTINFHILEGDFL